MKPELYHITVPVKRSFCIFIRHKRFFLRHGFTCNANHTQWSLMTSNKRIMKRIERFCTMHSYKIRYVNKKYERASNYRTKWLQHYSPDIFGRYLCTYCGKLLTKDKVAVDHIIPIGQVQKSIKYQRMINRLPSKNVNDLKNLCPACHRCNSKKAAKTGLWITKGRIYRHQWMRQWRFLNHILCWIFVFSIISYYIFLYYCKGDVFYVFAYR